MIHAFAFELKELGTTGEFTGLASTYSNTDLGNDAVMPGAFTRTLADKGNFRPLLLDHKTPIGRVQLEDTPRGLLAHGKLSLELQSAKDAYVMLRDQILNSMSIGFSTVREEMKGGVRQLLELKLWECSLVLFPMNPSAQVLAVKALEDRKIQLALAELRRALKTF